MFKRFLCILLCVFLVVIVSGCSSIKNTVYKSSESAKIMEEAGKSNLTQEERQLFAQAILRSAFTKESLDGKKIGEIIDEQRKIGEEQSKKQQEEERKKQEEEKAAKLKEANAKIISAGNKITNESMEITINKVELSYDVLPDKTSSFYTHYPAKKGNVYISIDVDVKNLRKQQLPCEEVMTVEADYNGGFRYKSFPVAKDSKGEFTYTSITNISPLETAGMKFLIDCPEEVDQSKNPLFLLFDVEKEKYKYVIR